MYKITFVCKDPQELIYVDEETNELIMEDPLGELHKRVRKWMDDTVDKYKIINTTIHSVMANPDVEELHYDIGTFSDGSMFSREMNNPNLEDVQKTPRWAMTVLYEPIN